MHNNLKGQQSFTEQFHFLSTNGLVSINQMPDSVLDHLSDNPSELYLLKKGSCISKSDSFWCYPPYPRSLDFEFLEEHELNINHD